MKTAFALSLAFLLVSGFYLSHHHKVADAQAQQIQMMQIDGVPVLRSSAITATTATTSHAFFVDAPMNPRRVLTRIIGTDEQKRSADFHVDSPHWWISCSSKRTDPGMTMQVIAVPRVGNQNIMALNLKRDGFATTSVNNPGDWHLEVLGFSCAWEVTVEEEIP